MVIVMFAMGGASFFYSNYRLSHRDFSRIFEGRTSTINCAADLTNISGLNHVLQL